MVSMVSSAVLGAAAGTGLALVVAMTIVVYRYYAFKRKGKYWSSLDRWPDPPSNKNNEESLQLHRHHQYHDSSSSSSYGMDNWRKPQQSYYAVQTALACGGGGGGSGGGIGGGSAGAATTRMMTTTEKSSSSPGGGGSGSSTASKIGVVTGVAIIRGKWAQRGCRSPLSSATNVDSADSTTSTSSEEFSIAKEQHAVQPSPVMVESGLPHQSRSYPGGGGRAIARNSSVSSQSSQEGASGPSPHRGSSPQIRAFGPDGRHHQHHRQHDPLHAASSYPPNRSSRSPSPGRTASLDARCGSPGSYSGSLHSGNASPSQSSLSSFATGVSSSCGYPSISGVQGTPRASRCLSPLLIPPPRTSISSDGGPAPPASPLGSLQPDLYQRRDEPVFLRARRTGKSLGKLHLRLEYDFDRSDLHVHLIEAHDLAGSDQGGFNDPYVKLTLSPEVDTRKRQTDIHRNDSNPLYDHRFKFPVSYEELQEKTLVLQVFDYDRFSRNDIVGSVRIAMDRLELPSTSSSIEIWGEIERERKPPEEIQQVLLSLSYLPSAQKLTVNILEARNLFPPQEKETLDPFVKVNLLCGDKGVKKKKKTSVKKATTSPVWNEPMSFDVSARSLPTSAIEVCVLDSSSELIRGNVIVGSCIVGPVTGSTRGSEASGNQSREHWLQMTQSPREVVTMWHTLH